MTVEIKEMVVRTTISGSGGETVDAQGCNGMEAVKQEVLVHCLEWLADYLARQKDR